MMIDGKLYDHLTPERADEILATYAPQRAQGWEQMLKPLTADIRPDRAALPLAAYEAAGGYQGLRKALAMTPVQVQQAVTAAGLRGRGGAGFPTGMKWSFVPMRRPSARDHERCTATSW